MQAYQCIKKVKATVVTKFEHAAPGNIPAYVWLLGDDDQSQYRQEVKYEGIIGYTPVAGDFYVENNGGKGYFVPHADFERDYVELGGKLVDDGVAMLEKVVQPIAQVAMSPIQIAEPTPVVGAPAVALTREEEAALAGVSVVVASLEEPVAVPVAVIETLLSPFGRVL